MTGFPLKIVTPDGLLFDGMAEQVTVRTITGDLGVLAGHINCVVPLGMGRATIVVDGKKRYAACIGGMLSVLNGSVSLVPTTFEWADKIDAERAERAEKKAREILAAKNGCTENGTAHFLKPLFTIRLRKILRGIAPGTMDLENFDAGLGMNILVSQKPLFKFGIRQRKKLSFGVDEILVIHTFIAMGLHAAETFFKTIASCIGAAFNSNFHFESS